MRKKKKKQVKLMSSDYFRALNKEINDENFTQEKNFANLPKIREIKFS